MTNSIRRRDPDGIMAIAWALAAVLLAAALSSCSPKIVEKIIRQTDTTYVDRVRIDSIAQRDSIFIKEKGDTIFIYKEKFVEKTRWVHDTTRLVQRDSIVVEVPKEVKVEKPLSAWKRAKIGAFWWLLAGLLAALAWIFRKPLLGLLKL